jgi:hypothetical protein
MLVEKGIFDFDTARESLPDTVPDHLIHRWLRTIKASEWKGRQLPPGTRVTPTASGFGRRIPINNQWDGVIPVH